MERITLITWHTLDVPERLPKYLQEMPGEWTSTETSLVLIRKLHSQRRRSNNGKLQLQATTTKLHLSKTPTCQLPVHLPLLMQMTTRCNSCQPHKDTLVLHTLVSKTLMTISLRCSETN